MDKKSKILFLVFGLFILGAVGATYLKYFVLKDYYIQAEAECDPVVEKCFVYECTPEEDVDCPANEDERISYYKYVKKKAYLIPLCDPNDEECDALTCEEGQDCEEILCDETSGGECNDPEEYLAANPIEEEDGEVSECLPEDEECLPLEETDGEACDSESEGCDAGAEERDEDVPSDEETASGGSKISN
jgi:hypothetical protein